MIILRSIEQIIHIPSVTEHLSLNIEMLNQSIMQMELILASIQYVRVHPGNLPKNFFPLN